MGEEKMISFYTWLMRRKDDDNQIGDLARDAKDDKDANAKTFKTKESTELHLLHKNACSEALETLDYAWEEYIGCLNAETATRT